MTASYFSSIKIDLSLEANYVCSWNKGHLCFTCLINLPKLWYTIPCRRSFTCYTVFLILSQMIICAVCSQFLFDSWSGVCLSPLTSYQLIDISSSQSNYCMFIPRPGLLRGSVCFNVSSERLNSDIDFILLTILWRLYDSSNVTSVFTLCLF